MTEGKVHKADKVQMVYQKTIKLGKVDGYGNGTKNCAAEIEVEVRSITKDYDKLTVDLEPIRSYHELSICGAIWNHIHTDWVSGGQNDDELLGYFPDDPRVAEIVKTWDRWHLNGMISGSRRQSKAIDEYRQANPLWRYDYGEACEILKAQGLYEDRGYKYGHAWLVEPLPQEIIEQVKTW
jgi:hypothetical protein